MNSAIFGLTACLTVGFAGICPAQELKAERQFTDTEVGFALQGAFQNFTLTVSGPNGVHAIAHGPTAAPTIDLRRLGAIDDGTYNYQLSASTGERVPLRSRLDNGREPGTAGTMFKTVSVSGQFQVKGGAIVKVDPNAREDVKRQK